MRERSPTRTASDTSEEQDDGYQSRSTCFFVTNGGEHRYRCVVCELFTNEPFTCPCPEQH